MKQMNSSPFYVIEEECIVVNAENQTQYQVSKKFARHRIGFFRFKLVHSWKTRSCTLGKLEKGEVGVVLLAPAKEIIFGARPDEIQLRPRNKREFYVGFMKTVNGAGQGIGREHLDTKARKK